MSTTEKLRERMAAPDWDMWLALAGNVLERLADAKDARRARQKEEGKSRVPNRPPEPPATPAGLLRSVLPEAEVSRSPLPASEAKQARATLTRGGFPATLARPRFRAAPQLPRSVAYRAGRRLNRAAGVLAASALADSVAEQCRGQSQNKALYMPLAASTLSVLVSAHGMADKRPAAHGVREASYIVAALAGLAGTAFHVFNVGSRGGEVSSRNLFLKTSFGLPGALTMSGMVGFLAERVRNNWPGTTPHIFGLPAGRVIGLATSAGLMGTAVEAGILVLRGAFRDPLMYVPMTVPPPAAAAIGKVALGVATVQRRTTRWWLRAAALAGFAGSAWRLYAVGRAVGRRRNWRQNVIDGPPIPAPPAFTGLALAGLAALDLLEHADG